MALWNQGCDQLRTPGPKYPQAALDSVAESSGVPQRNAHHQLHTADHHLLHLYYCGESLSEWRQKVEDHYGLANLPAQTWTPIAEALLFEEWLLQREMLQDSAPSLVSAPKRPKLA